MTKSPGAPEAKPRPSIAAQTPILGYGEAEKLGRDTLWLPAWAYWLLIFALYLAAIAAAALLRWMLD